MIITKNRYYIKEEKLTVKEYKLSEQSSDRKQNR